MAEHQDGYNLKINERAGIRSCAAHCGGSTPGTLGQGPIETITATRHLQSGDVMIELGFSNLNGSLGYALAQSSRLQPDVLVASEKWIADNASI